MRRKDREICSFEDIIAVMQKCDVCRLALNTDSVPYILPLNFGMQVKDGRITLYFHGAAEGTKYKLIEKDNRAAFEMDCAHRLVMDEIKGSCSMEYESVIGEGYIEFVPDEEKYDALCILMSHYHQEDFGVNKKVVPNTKVLKLTVEKVTAKRHVKNKPKEEIS